MELTGWEYGREVSELEQADLERVARRYSQARNAIFAWGMGLTHHKDGAANIEALANPSALELYRDLEPLQSD